MEKITALFVDDETDILKLLKMNAAPLYTDILTAERPSQALAILESRRIDVAVLDYKMPEMDGVTLFQKMKAIQPDICGVFLTAHGEKNLVQQALRMEAFDFLDKPCSMESLISTLTKLNNKVLEIRRKTAEVSIAKMVVEKHRKP